MEDEVGLINKVLANQEYHAQGKLNQGSYGEIYRVVHNQTKSVYALKALQLSKLFKMNKMHEALFEIFILKKLSHPGIIKIYSNFKKQNYIGIVLELCPYRDMFNLMKLVSKRIQLAQKKRKIIIYYVAQIIEALDYLHEKMIVHRDIKPQNIVLGNDLKIRLVDFGTAKVLNTNFLTQGQLEEISKVRTKQFSSEITNEFVGTIYYLSPEALKLNYSTKTDIWALGVLVYKFLYEKFPFQAQNNVQILHKIAEQPLIFDKIDNQMQQFLTMCLKRDAQLRASTKDLKKCSLFKEIQFNKIFLTQPPITKQQLYQPQTVEVTPQFLLQIPLQKKMFFGNFKPRLLTVTKVQGRLMMAYRYTHNKQIKHEFQLNLNDYAQIPKNGEKTGQFQVVTAQKKYTFRVGKTESCLVVIQKINNIIKKGYNL